MKELSETSKKEMGKCLFHSLNSQELAEFFLICGADVNIEYSGSSPLVHSCRKGNLPISKLFIEYGANVNYVSSAYGTPLICALPYPELVKLLLNSGADVNGRTISNWTALMYACTMHDSLELVKLLIDKGADINAMTDLKSTPLAIAIFNQNVESVRVLVEKGADVNCVDYLGRTPLMRARERKSQEIISILLNAGAK